MFDTIRTYEARLFLRRPLGSIIGTVEEVFTLPGPGAEDKKSKWQIKGKKR